MMSLSATGQTRSITDQFELGYEAFSVNLGMLFGGQNPNPMLKNFGMHVRPCSHP